jgi:hypothetical protein
VLDERERRGRHGRECDERRTPPGLHTVGAGLRVPRDNHLLGRPETLERQICCVRLIKARRNVMGDRILEVVPKLGAQPRCSCAMNLCGNGGELGVDVGHWLSTACTLAANRSQSARRPSRALRPRAVRS